MTPARKAALQWFHDRGEVRDLWGVMDRPSMRIVDRMLNEGHLEFQYVSPKGGGIHRLTDKGRRALHGDDK